MLASLGGDPHIETHNHPRVLAGKAMRDQAQRLCDFAATALSAEEAVRQELHRLRREGAAFVPFGGGTSVEMGFSELSDVPTCL